VAPAGYRSRLAEWGMAADAPGGDRAHGASTAIEVTHCRRTLPASRLDRRSLDRLDGRDQLLQAILGVGEEHSGLGVHV
jgi:hypothetical protein